MIIESDLLKIGKMAARENTRYSINSVQIVQKGRKCSICATDGKRILLAEWDLDSKPIPGTNLKALVPANVCAEVVKAGRGHRIDFDGKQFTFNGSSINAEVDTDSHFPDYRAILNSEPGSVDRIGFDPKLFYPLLQVMGALVDPANKGVEFIMGKGPARPITLKGETESGVKLTGMIMPVNLGDER